MEKKAVISIISALTLNGCVMTIKSIRVKNLLSFDDFLIDDINDFNCIIGKNNVGKSNVLKLLRFFYDKLNNEKKMPPNLNSNYDSFGSITLTYDLSRIKTIVMSNQKSTYLKHINSTFFSDEGFLDFFDNKKIRLYSLTLKVFKDGTIAWSDNKASRRETIYHLFPFFDIDSRHIDLYDWNKVWDIVSKLNTFNLKDIKNNDVIDFLDSKVGGGYKKYVESVEKIIDTKTYSYRDRVLSYIKIAIRGHDFVHFGEDIKIQSDGTNSHKFIEVMLTLLITLTRREFISPFIYIDEPEVGLHPKLNEKLINKIYSIYTSFKKTKKEHEPGKYNTPYPKVIFSTHSPNILKQCIKLFKENNKIYHFTKKNKYPTKINVLNSKYSDSRVFNSFGDNEARLFFSDYILFVEGQTEIELFNNLNLSRKFDFLNSVDVYATDKVILKFLASSYSKDSIPFLILYDADKIIKYSKGSGKVVFSNDDFNLEKSMRKFKFYYDESERQYVSHLHDYLENKKTKNNHLNKLGISYLTSDNEHLIESVNYISNKKGYHFLNNTIEGALLSDKSKILFEKFFSNVVLKKVFQDNMDPTNKIKNIISNGDIDYIKEFNSLFSLNDKGFDCRGESKLFLNKVKVEYLRAIKNKISSFSGEDFEIILYRLILNGKTDSLISLTNANHTLIDSGFRHLIKEVKEKDLKIFSPYTSKTGGWVTEFLDFSILELEKSDDIDFKKKFKLAFPELSYILDTASSSIEVGGVRT